MTAPTPPVLDGEPRELVPSTTTQAKRLALLNGPDAWWKPPLVYAFSFAGGLDLDRLETALQLLAYRHSGLRTCFEPGSSIDVAGCLPPESARWPFDVVVSRRDAEGAQADLDATYAWLQRDFDPYERPLVRARVLRREDDDLLGLSIEHSLFDAASAQVLFEDLTTVYDGLLTSPTSTFSEVVSDAVEFARTERSWMEGEEGAAALEWWDARNEGLGATPRVHLPEVGAFRPYAPIIDCPVHFSAEEVARLRQRATSLRLTVVMLAAAATTVTLREHSPTDDIPFLFAHARRAWPVTKDLVAYCANRSLVRVEAGCGETVTDVAGRVRGAMLDAVRHGMLSHEEYVRLRYPAAFERQPVVPYAHLNTVVQSSVPTLGGVAGRKVSLPVRPAIFHQPGLNLNLGLFADGTGTLQGSFVEGMYERSFMEELTATIARRCVEGD